MVANQVDVEQKRYHLPLPARMRGHKLYMTRNFPNKGPPLRNCLIRFNPIGSEEEAKPRLAT